MGGDRVAAALMHTSGLNADGLAGSLMDMGLGHRDPDAHLHSHTYPQLPTMNVSRVLEHAQMGGHSLPAHAAPHSLHYTPLLEPRLELEGFSEGFPVLQDPYSVAVYSRTPFDMGLFLPGDGDLGNEIIGWVGREGDKRFKERLREQQQLPLPPLPAPLDPDSRGAYPAAGGREAGLAGPAGPGGSAAGP
eukprot:Tamp_31080.p1 GENE.Tamp_31080~~Tamp_31080.p1  ORF type:complete len:201 (+),score=23.02 Tamp_31080:34-603(+)